MTGVEIDMVVPDSLAALDLYEKVFAAQKIEATAFAKGQNEAVFTIFGVRFHILDENPEYGLVAPSPGLVMPMWVNVLVEDIEKTYHLALQNGFSPVQPVTAMPAFYLSNAVVTDPFGFVWMLHQIDRVVPFEERVAYYEAQQNNG